MKPLGLNAGLSGVPGPRHIPTDTTGLPPAEPQQRHPLPGKRPNCFNTEMTKKLGKEKKKKEGVLRRYRWREVPEECLGTSRDRTVGRD